MVNKSNWAIVGRVSDRENITLLYTNMTMEQAKKRFCKDAIEGAGGNGDPGFVPDIYIDAVIESKSELILHEENIICPL